MTPEQYPCQVCGKAYPPRYLLDLKGNVPGGCKVTCLECAGRLQEREACARLFDVKETPPWCRYVDHIQGQCGCGDAADAIRARKDA